MFEVEREMRRWEMIVFCELCVLLSLAHAYVCGDCAGRGVGNMLWEEGFIFSQRAGTRRIIPRARTTQVKAHRLPPLNLTRCTSCVRCDSKTTSRSATGGILDRFIRSLRPQPQCTAAALMILPR